MSKKELVKNVIDDLIGQGKDFHEITQGTLSHVKELENVSKTTIKRAKNEYKKEKIVVKSNYKETLIKRKIYKYLDRYPKTTLSDLREALPEIPPKKVSEYHLYWTRKRDKTKADKAQKGVMVNPRKLKEMVFSHLNANEDATCEDLFSEFPDANKSSLTSYFGHWKKKRANHDKGKEGSLYQVIFRFLNSHPDATIDELQKSFSDVPHRSLEVYHNLWQKKKSEEQQTKAESPTAKPGRKRKAVAVAKKMPRQQPQPTQTLKSKQVAKSSEPGRSIQKTSAEKMNDAEVPFIENKKISELKKTIEAQKLTLTALEVENSMLKDTFQSKLLEGFETISSDELKDIKEFIKTYVKGLEII